jgi:glucosamine kinase
MSDFFLGVDGGQSSTTAVIGDASGQVVGWAVSGPCNHVGASEGRAKFLRVMRECLSQAATRAGLDPERPSFVSACLGMSGGPDDKAGLMHELLEAKHLQVTHDGQIALAGATGGKPGIIVVAGTGSIAFGESKTGETARAGGWGYIFGDEGGGFDIARQALRAILREHEGWGPHTALTPALLEATGTQNANQMLHLLYTAEWPRSKVATLARVVNALAEQSDPVALDILRAEAQSLALLGAAVRRQLWSDDSREPVKLAWIGGVFQSTILLERFRQLAELDAVIQTGPPEHSPAVGALMLACRAAGVIASPGPVPGIKV